MYMSYRQTKNRDQVWVNRLVAALGDKLLSDIRQHTLVEAANGLYPTDSPETKNRQVQASSILH